MRYIIIFLIGFFLGGFFGGDLGLFIQKTKSLVLPRSEKQEDKETRVEPKTAEYIPKTKPKVVEVTQSKRPELKQKAAVAVAKKETTPADRETIYAIQVAAFKTKEQASQYVEELSRQEYDAYIAPSGPSEPSKFRVCIGETISMEQAKALNTKLKAKFKDSFIYEF